jgi:hypothetical protein
MVGARENFSKTQGPEHLQNPSQPRQRPSLEVGLIVVRQPMSEAGQRLAQKGRSGLRRIQAAGPAAEGGGIGHAIGILERRRSPLPGAVLHKAPLQCLTASRQAVVRVRERKPWQEGEGVPATGATTATDADPVVMLVVRLLAAASVADDRIVFANGASPDDFVAVCSPIGFELVGRSGKWDKENRSSSGLRPGTDLPKI